MNIQEFQSYNAALEAVFLAVKQAKETTQRVTILVPGFLQTEAVKAALAEKGLGLGVAVETMNSWVDDLWELYGDGRVLVDIVQRELVIRQCLERRRKEEPSAYPVNNGIVRLVANILRTSAPAIEQVAVNDREDLIAGEREALIVAQTCLDCFKRQGMLERSQMCSYLQAAGVLTKEHVIVFDVQTSFLQDCFLETAAHCEFIALSLNRDAGRERAQELNLLQKQLFSTEKHDAIAPEGAVRFALPSGEYASNRILYQELCKTAKEAGSQIAFACANPFERFEALAQALARAGFTAQVEALVPFGKTHFGRAWISLIEALHTRGGLDAAGFADYALSSFSFTRLQDAYRTDAHIRTRAATQIEDALENLQGAAKEEYRDFLYLVAQEEYEQALRLQEQAILQHYNPNDMYQSLQLSAICFARDIYTRAKAMHLSQETIMGLFESMGFNYSCSYSEQEQDGSSPCVVFTTQRKLAQCTPQSYDAVLLADLSAEKFPFQEQETALAVLLEKLHIYKDPHQLQSERKQFMACIAAARNCVVLERPLHDASAEESRPCVLLEELQDCYREDPSDFKTLNKALMVPNVLLDYVATQGEDALVENFLIDANKQSLCMEKAFYAAGFPALEENGKKALHAGRINSGHAFTEVKFSASAIEKLLACPYTWFLQNRIGAQELSFDFGPLEKGNFVHELMKDFHEALAAHGISRVTPENELFAAVMMNELFDKKRAEHSCSFRENDLVAKNAYEETELEQLRQQLLNFVNWETDFLPAFTPMYHEYEFGKDKNVKYAGVNLHGFIDRIDVDPYGRAVIIDYKGSVNDNYNYRKRKDDEPLLPPKVQTLIYAQIVRRELGLTPVAALYVSYGAKHSIAGLFNRSYLNELSDLKGDIDLNYNGSYFFLNTLDNVENAISERLKSLMEGYISPNPRDEKACEYCPVLACDMKNKPATEGEEDE